MQFQKVLLTEPYDSAIALRYVETRTFSDELKYRILETHFKPDEEFKNFFKNLSSPMQPVV